MRILIAFLVTLMIPVSGAAFSQTDGTLALSCVISSVDTMPEECAESEITLYGSDPKGRYSDLIDRLHAKWLITYSGDEYVWDHVHFLNAFNALSNCLLQEVAFNDCNNAMDAPIEDCMAQGAYTTIAMNICVGIKIQILRPVLNAEIAIMQDQHRDFTPQDEYHLNPIATLRKSQEAWENFVQMECDRRYYRYYGGSIAGQVYRSCVSGFTIDRIQRLHDENTLSYR